MVSLCKNASNEARHPGDSAWIRTARSSRSRGWYGVCLDVISSHHRAIEERAPRVTDA
jgi:hypothetical protein